jgi:hypothetical protein
MKNEKGEVVIGVMAVLMVVMMVFGHMGMGHRDHGGGHGHHMVHEHSGKQTQHAHDGGPVGAAQPAGEEDK